MISCMILMYGGSLSEILIWKESHSLLSDNKYGTTGTVFNSVKDLRLTNKLEAYDNIMQEQRANEIIENVEEEEVNKTVTERVFYLPHIPVIRESTEKNENKNDASAKVCQTCTSLNEYLEIGLPSQN